MKKKGFTLIELLAVVVILGILLGIIVPKIINVISTAKQNAFVSTNKIIENEIGRINSLEVIPQIYTFENGVMTPDLGITGKLPTSGTIEINSNKEIQILTKDEDFCAIKRFAESEIKSYEKDSSDCNISSEMSLTINPNGGTYDGSTNDITYNILPDGKIVLDTPAKDDNIFAGWDVNCDSCLVDDIYTVGNSSDTITATWELYENAYTYTGNSTLVEDSPGHWKLKFLTSGTFTPLINMTIDAFLVGGGGGGSRAGAGAGGGYTKTSKIITLIANTSYTIDVGSGGAASTSQGNTGGTTTAFGVSALGGTGGANTTVAGAGNGGSGGGDPWSTGGTNGSKGIGTNGTYGTGQITTTREFSEITGTLYAAGGGGEYYSNPVGGRGVSGTANTGNGGSSNYSGTIGSGGSGVVIIKSSNPMCVGSTAKYCFKYTALYSVDNPTTDNYKINFLESGTLKSLLPSQIDIFLVGGGGGGETNCYICSGAGSGYTTTVKKVDVSSMEYSITIGAGGAPNTTQGVRGGTTTAFGNSALGGYGGGEVAVAGSGNGGSGGGDFSYTGGTDGSNGNHTNGVYGVGQGTSTREFAELSGTLYAMGGSGGNAGDKGASGASNTGKGGASNCTGGGGNGGSGIVVIRKSNPTCVGDTTKYCFRYSGYFTIDNQTEDIWKIKFLTSGTFEPTSNMSLDAFLVGGGGGGGSRAGGGGGGGYTTTQLGLEISENTNYVITVGAGGAKGINEGTGGTGGTTSAFTYTALGGTGGLGNLSSPQCKGGSGGAGGGGGTGFGGAGGNGGNDGNNGITGVLGTYGIGQGTTTREFAEPTGALYGSGGGGGNIGVGSNGAGSGGNLGIGFSATANTGGGGGGGGSGASYEGGLGGSGIVIIRAS